MVYLVLCVVLSILCILGSIKCQDKIQVNSGSRPLKTLQEYSFKVWENQEFDDDLEDRNKRDLGQVHGILDLDNQNIILEKDHTDFEQDQFHMNLEQEHSNLEQQNMNLDQESINLGQDHMNLEQDHMSLEQEHANLEQRNMNLDQESINLGQDHMNLVAEDPDRMDIKQPIRHARSRYHMTRSGRDKKTNDYNRFIDHSYYANEAPDLDMGIQEKFLPLKAADQKNNPPSNDTLRVEPATPPSSPSSAKQRQEEKYDLRSFFGFTSSPRGTEPIPADHKITMNKTMRGEETVTLSGETPSTQSPVNKQIKPPNRESNILEKPPPKSSLEAVHSFINHKNRAKKKDDMKMEAELESTGASMPEEELENTIYTEEDPTSEISVDGIKVQGHADVVTRFLRIVETQHLLGENCTAGTDMNLGEGVVDRYAQERFRVEADVAVNRANMLTRLWKYAETSVMHSEYLLHASVFSMVEFDDDIFAAGNCYDQYQYKDYQLFCPFAYRLPEGPILVKDLAVEYKYLSNTSEWFYIARKNAENVIKNYNQFSRGFNTYTYNESAHTDRVPDDILSVTYDDGKWSKPYYDCGGGNIWMLTYTVPFFGYANDTYFFKGTSGIDIDLRRVDIDQCPLQAGTSEHNIFAATDKCKKRTTDCVPLPGLGFRRGSYKCVCRRGFYFPQVLAEHRFYNGTDIEEEYEKLMLGEVSRYGEVAMFECLPCAEGCEACVDNSPCVVSLNWLLRSAILALSCFVISLLPIVIFFTWKYGNVKVVRAASPVLLRVIVLGALFIYCTNIVMYPRPTVYLCTARVWLREIGFCLTYGALMLKTWRISVIFRVRSAKAVKITDFNLLKRLGVIVGIFSVFLVIRTLVAPPVVIVGRTATDLKAYLCKTDWWDHSFTTMEVIFLIWGIRLCIVVRKAPSEFNESRFISMAIYNEFLLSVFLNISMLFLQSPANPDLLYIIFFCHTQLTITLLLCFIFGSKAYLVFKGHGKGDHEGSSMVQKTPAGKFMSKPRSVGNSQYATSTNSSAGLNEYTKVTEHDIQEEFRRLYNQLEQLKDKNMRFGNRHLTAKICAMQEAAALQDTQAGGGRKGAGGMFSAMADKLACAAITPAEESSSSGREYVLEHTETQAQTQQQTKSKKLNVTFSPVKTCSCTSDQDNLPNSKNQKTKNSKSTDNGSPKNKSDANGDSVVGCDTCLSKVEEAEVAGSVAAESGSSVAEGSPGSPNGTTNSNSNGSKATRTPIKSGHARTHAIVINLDDKSRFTEEVTV